MAKKTNNMIWIIVIILAVFFLFKPITEDEGLLEVFSSDKKEAIRIEEFHNTCVVEMQEDSDEGRCIWGNCNIYTENIIRCSLLHRIYEQGMTAEAQMSKYLSEEPDEGGFFYIHRSDCPAWGISTWSIAVHECAAGIYTMPYYPCVDNSECGANQVCNVDPANGNLLSCVSTSGVPGDTNGDGIVSRPELGIVIDGWLAVPKTFSRDELGIAIQNWIENA